MLDDELPVSSNGLIISLNRQEREVHLSKKNLYFPLYPVVLAYKDLTDFEKMFLCVVMSLSTKTGECWAKNQYFAELFQKNEKQIRRTTKELHSKNYLDISFANNDTRKRAIKITKQELLLIIQGDKDRGQNDLGQNDLGQIVLGQNVRGHRTNCPGTPDNSAPLDRTNCPGTPDNLSGVPLGDLVETSTQNGRKNRPNNVFNNVINNKIKNVINKQDDFFTKKFDDLEQEKVEPQKLQTKTKLEDWQSEREAKRLEKENKAKREKELLASLIKYSDPIFEGKTYKSTFDITSDVLYYLAKKFDLDESVVKEEWRKGLNEIYFEGKRDDYKVYLEEKLVRIKLNAIQV